MSVSEIISYDKNGEVERWPLFRKLFLSLVIILVALLSFGVGRLSVAENRESVKIEYDPRLTTGNQQPVTNPVSINQVMASKNGSKYHYPHCAGAKQIKEENKIVFATPAAAEASGFTLAANCLPR